MERDFEDYINSIKSIISLRTLMHRYHENGTQTNSVATNTGTDEHSLPAISMQQDRSTPRRSFSEYDNYGYSDFCETVEELKTTRKRLYSLITELSREKVRLTRENKEIKRENDELQAWLLQCQTPPFYLNLNQVLRIIPRDFSEYFSIGTEIFGLILQEDNS